MQKLKPKIRKQQFKSIHEREYGRRGEKIIIDRMFADNYNFIIEDNKYIEYWIENTRSKDVDKEEEDNKGKWVKSIVFDEQKKPKQTDNSRYKFSYLLIWYLSFSSNVKPHTHALALTHIECVGSHFIESLLIGKTFK